MVKMKIAMEFVMICWLAFLSFLIHDPYFDVGHRLRESISVVTLDKKLWASHGTGPRISRYFVKCSSACTVNSDASVWFSAILLLANQLIR